MADFQNNLKPCCDPHHKYHKQLKFLAIKTALVDLVLVFTAIILICASKYLEHIIPAENVEVHTILYAIGCTVGVLGIVGMVMSGIVCLIISISYHIHNAHDLHGKKDLKSSVTNKKNKK